MINTKQRLLPPQWQQHGRSLINGGIVSPNERESFGPTNYLRLQCHPRKCHNFISHKGPKTNGDECNAPSGNSSQYPRAIYKVHNEATFLGSCRSTRSTRRTRRAAPSTACRPGAPGTRRRWHTAAEEDLKIWKKY